MGVLIDWILDEALPYILTITVPVMLIGVGILIYISVTAETFALRKDQWVCTKSHEETYTTYININKVMVPQTSTSDVCDQWTHR